MEDFGSEWSRGVRVALLEDSVDGTWPSRFFHANLTSRFIFQAIVKTSWQPMPTAKLDIKLSLRL